MEDNSACTSSFIFRPPLPAGRRRFSQCTMHDVRYAKIGFTLIELLIVSAVLSVVSLAVYATFNSGIKIWYRVNKPIQEEDINIFFDKFGADLRNSFSFSDIYFHGIEHRCEFPTLVHSSRLGKRTVGQIIYFYDPAAETLSREERDFSHIYDNTSGAGTLTLKNIISLNFQYYVHDEKNKEYFWLNEWREKKPPFAVRIELESNDGARTDRFIKTVSIPAGS